MRVERPGQVQTDLERMAVQATALMPGGNVGQAVGRFESKFFEDFHALETLENNAGVQFISMPVTRLAAVHAAARW